MVCRQRRQSWQKQHGEISQLPGATSLSALSRLWYDSTLRASRSLMVLRLLLIWFESLSPACPLTPDVGTIASVCSKHSWIFIYKISILFQNPRVKAWSSSILSKEVIFSFINFSSRTGPWNFDSSFSRTMGRRKDDWEKDQKDPIQLVTS